MEVFDSSSFTDVVNSVDIVIPDGKPLSIAPKLLGDKNVAQARGQNIMNTLCERSGEKSLNIGFYGGVRRLFLVWLSLNLLLSILISRFVIFILRFFLR
ncbi:MAG: hypothetical protein DRQ61_11405 [Gammaproteobacteria bacterium]|nr:MAG: hypothetical protein DRQ61_11405 [Gammaproteobacteria bacterium]